MLWIPFLQGFVYFSSYQVVVSAIGIALEAWKTLLSPGFRSVTFTDDVHSNLRADFHRQCAVSFSDRSCFCDKVFGDNTSLSTSAFSIASVIFYTR